MSCVSITYSDVNMVEGAAVDLACRVQPIGHDFRVLQALGFPIHADGSVDGRQSVWRVRQDHTTGTGNAT